MPNHNYIKTRKGIIDLMALKEKTDLTVLYGSGKMRCLWHDDNVTPNLQIYPDHVYCFACGKATDAISFVMAMEGKNFYDAVMFLQENINNGTIKENRVVEPISMEEINRLCEQLWANLEPIEYLKHRGILATPIIDELKLGYDFNSITIPHFVNGSCVNIKFRNLTANGPKYNSLPGRKFEYLYPYDYFRQHFSDSKILYLCEGEFDCILLLQEDLPAMSVPAGANTDLGNFIPFFKRFEHIVVLSDHDAAGEKMYTNISENKLSTGYSIAEMTPDTRYYLPFWENGKDVTDARLTLIPQLKANYAKGF